MSRIEKDYVGELAIPKNALYGIHSLRAANNFPDTTRFHIEWYQALGTVKRACYETYIQFNKAVNKHEAKELIHERLQLVSDEVILALVKSACEVETGNHFEHFIVPAIQGGAGTSINMNANEIITNLALQKLDKNPGSYEFIDPIEQANVYQSTNDVIPTSLKLAILRLLTDLETSINNLRLRFESLEKNHRNHLRSAYTQMQAAVPTTFGRLFGTYSEALSRDWWRVSKCFERIKVVNLGGSAIGTGITVPGFYIREVVQTLQRISGLPITRAENLSDATNNLDPFVEVHAILKAHAVNLEKIVNDIRLLSSDLVTPRELEIPKKQVGSSIMPGKINPVIPEFVISATHKIAANDVLIGSLAAQGCLELNAYIPVIGHSLLESIKLLIACCNTIELNLLEGLTVHSDVALAKLLKNPSITTILIPVIGYNRAGELAKRMKDKHLDIVEANNELHCIDKNKLQDLLKPEKLLQEGFSINDILND
jgi:aspartate ammonia-lyase